MGAPARPDNRTPPDGTNHVLLIVVLMLGGAAAASIVLHGLTPAAAVVVCFVCVLFVIAPAGDVPPWVEAPWVWGVDLYRRHQLELNLVFGLAGIIGLFLGVASLL